MIRSSNETPEMTDEQAYSAMELLRASRRGEPGVAHSQAMTAGRLVSRYLKETDRRLAEERMRGR